MVEELVGDTAGNPPIFGYEMCCAGMLGDILPHLNAFVAQSGHNEAYNIRDSRYSKAVTAVVVECKDFSGTYADSGGGRVSIQQDKCDASVENTYQGWQVTGKVVGDVIYLWDLKGLQVDECISWSNGAVWADFEGLTQDIKQLEDLKDLSIKERAGHIVGVVPQAG